MLFNARTAGLYTGISPSTLIRWSQKGLIPFGVRPLQDGYPTYHRWDLDYARDVVRPQVHNAGTVYNSRPMKRSPAGIVQGKRSR